jgi:hypothetical protein
MKSDEVLALIRAHFEGDQQRFIAMARVLEAHAVKSSPTFAAAIRRLVDGNHAMMILPKESKGLFINRPTAKLENLVVDPATMAVLDRIRAEHAARDRLDLLGLSPARKLLLVGPPGVGKTMTAAVLAGLFNLPLLRVQLHGVIDSHLGDTSKSLAKVFEAIAMAQAVYLFDEVDALAASRTGMSMGGADNEMRRVMSSLLQFIEDDDSKSYIVATTNLVEIIDPALLRRFDAVITFPLPDRRSRMGLVTRTVKRSSQFDDMQEILDASDGMSHADIIAACHQVNKDMVIANAPLHASDWQVVAALKRRRGPRASPDHGRGPNGNYVE